MTQTAFDSNIRPADAGGSPDLAAGQGRLKVFFVGTTIAAVMIVVLAAMFLSALR